MFNINYFNDLNIQIDKYNNYPKPYNIIKLMVYNKNTNEIIHDEISNLDKYFNKNDIIIINNSKTIPIKYKAYKIKNSIKSYIEIYLKKELNKEYNIWDVLVNPARKVRVGNKLFFKDKNKNTISSVVVSNTTSKGRIIKFDHESNYLLKKNIFPTGKFLLDPFTKYKKGVNIKYYENNYSKIIGSIRFPTAGVYLDKNILLKLIIKDIIILKITLHLNYNQLNDYNHKKKIIKNNKFNGERLIINKKKIKNINFYKKNKKICCIGINTLKAIENLINNKNTILPYNGYINNILYFPYRYRIVNSLLTYFNNITSINFLLLLNLCGEKGTHYIYEEAIKNNYKFNIYGDLLLVI